MFAEIRPSLLITVNKSAMIVHLCLTLFDLMVDQLWRA
jgi:hypothetical protein